jgi:hypothetical protein
LDSEFDREDEDVLQENRSWQRRFLAGPIGSASSFRALPLLTNDASGDGANDASAANGASDANGAANARFRREKANGHRLLPPEALPNLEQPRAKWRRVLLRREEFS